MTLRVEISIIPFGDEGGKRVIETINVSNIGVDAYEPDRYRYAVEHNGYKHISASTPIIEHFRDDGALVLARRALAVLTGKPMREVTRNEGIRN